MQTFVTNESIKETKIIDDINKKRSQPSNLFGLGLVSLIAACGSSGDADNGADNGANMKSSLEEGGIETTDTTETDTTEAAGASETSDTTEDADASDTTDTTEDADASDGTGLIFLSQSLGDPFGAAEPYRALTLTSDLVKLAEIPATYNLSYGPNRDPIFIDWNETEARATIEPANEDDFSRYARISNFKIGGNDGYDMVISAPYADHGTKVNTGAIYILWDVADYSRTNKTIDLGAPSTATSGLLSIYGGNSGDRIGTYPAHEFVKIGGNDGYDMVIRSRGADHDGKADTGAIYILWDVDDYYSTEDGMKHRTIDLGAPSTADSGLLSIYGGNSGDHIGNYNAAAPEFLKIGGNDGYDMVIRSRYVDHDGKGYAGAIYILWDVEDYSGSNTTIDLGAPSADTPGLLAIYGGNEGDLIGIYAPEFVNIGGNDEFDMVIHSPWVDHDAKENTGAIYVLWDVDDYYSTEDERKHKTIDLGDPFNVSAGLLSIYGANKGDAIRIHAPEFVNIGGKDDNYDMVIRASSADHDTRHGTTKRDTGAIYVLWDVADYSGSNNTIDLGDPSTATAGLLSIYGANQYDHIRIHAPEFVNIGGRNGDDMVINSPLVDHGTTKRDTGAIYILWDVTDYEGKDKTIDLFDFSGATAGVLAIYGANAGDQIGYYAPEFVNIGGKDDNYDMVIRSKYVNRFGDDNTGAIYILWDVADYSRSNTTIDLGNPSTAASGLLAIYGGNANDQIGIYAPEFVNIGGRNEDDMVIRSGYVDHGTKKDTGAIYILWDVADYYSTEEHKAINLGNPSTANHGLLTIYGANAGDQIGGHAPEFISDWGSNSNVATSMLIRSLYVDYAGRENAGAIYVLWDIPYYFYGSNKHKTIVLDSDFSDTVAGSLTIYGANSRNYIGNNAPQFVDIGGEAGNFDMVISSKYATGMNQRSNTEGAIYILWDVADYQASNTIIDLGNLSGATSGSLIIYNAAINLFASYDSANVLSADINDKGTDDLIFQSRGYTYILFGENLDDNLFPDEGNHQRLNIDEASLYSFDIESPRGDPIEDVGFKFKNDELERSSLDGFTVDSVELVWDYAQDREPLESLDNPIPEIA